MTTIEESSGTYIAQVKKNQKELLEDLEDHLVISKPFNHLGLLDKSHGRFDQRKGTFYDISSIEFAQRRKPCKLSTLIVIDRESTQLKTGKTTKERSFYVSNKSKYEMQTNIFSTLLEIIGKLKVITTFEILLLERIRSNVSRITVLKP